VSRAPFVRWTGFADLCFGESARLAFARASEHAMTDVYQAQPDAWILEDRRIMFSADLESGASQLEATKRLLSALVLQAVAGEAVIEVAQPPDLPERWVCKAATPSISKELVVSEAYDGAGETVRTAAS
jgi:vacuolar-type H+-ATPase subunit E/Vma4